ncbi:MAG: bifunctional phosphoglucose/phosphomannose isomerase [Bacteroidota bacterium]
MLTKVQTSKLDPQGMKKLLEEFPKQVAEAIKIGNDAKIKLNLKNINSIVLSGLGGSAIGGDLLRSYLSDDLKIPFSVSRNYFLPNFVDKNTLVIIGSYSGNTEETIASYKDAIKKGAKILAVSSGGVVTEMAKKNNHALIKIPGGLPPRAALGYSFFPLLVTFSKLKLIKNQSVALKETLAMLKNKSKEFSSDNNATIELAKEIFGKLPIVFSSADRIDSVNIRWRGQINENSKSLAYGHFFPELNHNEVVGWESLKGMMKNSHIIYLRDKEDHKRVALRMEITKDIIGKYADGITEVWSEGKSLLTRIFSLIHFGDWVSFYLAMLNNVDPTPVKKIDYLKQKLSEVK